jgi:hypothetical protein
MGIQVEFHVADKRVRALPDPSGGSFDAAGDFDRLVSRADPALPLLGGLDPHGETQVGAGQMEPLVAEIALLLTRATSGAEYRGLMRLHTMALRCAEEQGELLFIGD